MLTTSITDIGLSSLKPPPFSAAPISRSRPAPSSWFKFPNTKLLRVNCGYSCFEVRDVSYQPPGTQLKLLNSVSFSLPDKSLGLIFGQSGSGKTTLLQLLAGISKPTSGSIYTQKYGNDGNPSQPPEPLVPERVGIVFQFPERYFVADSVLDEVTFGWPRQKGSHQLRENLALGLQRAINWVGLSGIPLDKNPHSLSGGYKRRLALAIQLVQIPDLLILDEPLAGLGIKLLESTCRCSEAFEASKKGINCASCEPRFEMCTGCKKHGSQSHMNKVVEYYKILTFRVHKSS